jgi:excisionase family DNA binding protein
MASLASIAQAIEATRHPFAQNVRICEEGCMKSHPSFDPSHTAPDAAAASEPAPTYGGLPNRLLTAFEVAEFVGCHEETVRRAYWRGQLVAQRFGVRGRRFHPADVLDWIRRGAPTKPS